MALTFKTYGVDKCLLYATDDYVMEIRYSAVPGKILTSLAVHTKENFTKLREDSFSDSARSRLTPIMAVANCSFDELDKLVKFIGALALVPNIIRNDGEAQLLESLRSDDTAESTAPKTAFDGTPLGGP